MQLPMNKERKERKKEVEEIPRAHYARGNDDKWRGCVSGKKCPMAFYSRLGFYLRRYSRF